MLEISGMRFSWSRGLCRWRQCQRWWWPWRSSGPAARLHPAQPSPPSPSRWPLRSAGEKNLHNNTWARTPEHGPEHQPHLEVINGYLVLGGMSVGKRLEEGRVVTFGLQELTELFQHGGAMGRHRSITCQVALRDASKLGEELLGFWILCE